MTKPTLTEITRETMAACGATLPLDVAGGMNVVSPVTGEIVEANAALGDDPSLINQGATTDGWIAKVSVCLRASLSLSLSLSVCLSFCLSFCLSVCLSMHAHLCIVLPI